MNHIPVLVGEVLTFARNTDRVVRDGTLGHGGHTRALFDQYNSWGIRPTFWGCDKDPQMLAIAQKNLEGIEGNWLCHGYDEMIDVLSDAGVLCDFVLLDIGINWDHVLDQSRGFSIHGEGPLDMRFRPQGKTASELIAHAKKDEIRTWLMTYGDIGEKLAILVSDHLFSKKFLTTAALRDAILSVGTPRSLIAQCFQAFRIATNQEFRILESFLGKIQKVMAPGGRLGIITFHSGEDRIVKYAFNNFCDHGWQQCHKKAIQAHYTEKERNRASRSAKMRFIEYRP